jgi:hypothetical protein
MITSSSFSSIGGNKRLIPESVSMVVVTKKNIKRRKAISAVYPALTSGDDLFAINYLFTVFKSEKKHYSTCNNYK